jgi:exonuclease III
MKKLSPFLLFFLSAFIFSCNKDKSVNIDLPDSGEFSVLTYNVAGLPEGINADQHPTKHMQLVSPLLNAYDVVNVQEDFFYHDSLVKYLTLPDTSAYVAKQVLGDGLNTFSNIPFIDFARTKWNRCNGTDCLTPKGFSYCRLRFKTNVYVDLYNVHCNAGSDPLDYAARRDNVQQLCAYIRAHSDGNAVIVMGDFNSRYTRLDDNIRTVDSTDMKNVWVELLRGGVYPLQDGNSLSDCTPDATNATCEVVDKIFFRSSNKITLTPTYYQLDDPKFYDNTGDPLSDHKPMTAKFSYQVH